MDPSLEKISAPGLEVMTVRRPTYDKHFITAHPTDEDDPYSMFEAVAAFTRSKHAHIVSQFIFGGSDLVGFGVPEAERYNGYRDWPVTWIHGHGKSGARLSGTQALAITGPINTIWVDGEAMGSVIEDEDARYCLLGDVRPRDLEQSRPDQARELASDQGLQNIEFIHGDTGSKALDDLRADCVVINMVLHHTPSPAEIFRDVANHLAPNGIVLVTDLCSHDQGWARDNCGDLWLGFEPADLTRWANDVGLTDITSVYLAQRNGFQIQVRLFGHS